MTIILTSILHTHYYDKKGRKRAISMPDTNGILGNIRRSLPAAGRIVYVANDPHRVKENRRGFKPVVKGFKKSGIRFKEKYVLDDRTKKDASSIIAGADLIILSGGKILCQREFFNEIGLKDMLKASRALVIGVSAGTMNLCDTVCNFPEEAADLGQPLWVDGMGFYDRLIIPHFDGETLSYQLPCDEIDIVGDYILPLSAGKKLLGLDNDAYIMIEDGEAAFYGNIYEIADGKVKRWRDICEEATEK